MEVTSQLAQNLEAMAPFYTGKFIQEPHYFKEFEFSRQKVICAFRHLNKKCATKGLVV